MALISSKTILTSISLFHLTLAYFFLVDPAALDEQTLVFILGESMAMPYARGFDAPSQPLAFLGALLALVGLSDLVSLTVPEDVAGYIDLYYWGTQAPLRFTFSLALLFYTYLTGSSSPLRSQLGHQRSSGASSPPIPGADLASSSTTGWGLDGLKNRVFFTFMFVEMVSWFWIWVTLREERPAVVDRLRNSSQKREA